ncbi:MAG: hypothetical protein KJO86_04615, partial [Muriicola sp.]|nr:hypothetical protein [Muriicola sp.]
ALKISRNTVKKYLHLITVNGWRQDELLGMEEGNLEGLFSRPEESTPDRYCQLDELLPSYEKELKRVGVNRWVLWGEYMFPSLENHTTISLEKYTTLMQG